MSLNQIFSDFILLQSQSTQESLDLSLEAPFLGILHPKMVKAMMKWMMKPGDGAEDVTIPGWSYQCFGGAADALKAFPDLSIQKASVESIGRFWNSQEKKALFDFSPFGLAMVLRDERQFPKSVGFEQHILPPFLQHALSLDVWGPQGKWPRFHTRLTDLFEKHHLLSSSVPGKYSLKPDAKKLESLGIKITPHGDEFILGLPWTFALSELERLERIITQEF